MQMLKHRTEQVLCARAETGWEGVFQERTDPRRFTRKGLLLLWFQWIERMRCEFSQTGSAVFR